MIRLLCYEPAGRVLHLSADDLTRHVLGLGATGCGKTTGLINPVLRQVISRAPGMVAKKTGLLVLDPKEDDTADKVRAYAREAGRGDDVIVLSNTGDSFYGYFADLHRLDQVDEFTRRVLHGSQEMGGENAYWTEGRFGLVNSAMVMLLASGRALTFDRVADFLRAWLYEPDSAEVKDCLAFAERLLTTENLKDSTRRRLQLALLEAQNWKALDQRTRELHKSTLNNALRSLLSPAARDLFDESRPRRFNPSEVLSGKIMVASLNAVAHPNLAALLFKTLKRDYYEAVLGRGQVNPQRDRLCGLILDELPLSVMPEDVPALALLRSKGGFVVACAQGLNGLDEVLGRRQRAALLANFNSIFYFSSREDQTDEHAMVNLGTESIAERPGVAKDAGDVQIFEGTQPSQVRWVCPPGSLARLPQHHAYVRLANGATNTPVWLEPRFHEFDSPPVRVEPDDLAAAVRLLRAQDENAADLQGDRPLFLLDMHRRRHPLQLTPNIITAAWQLCRPQLQRNQILAKMGDRILDLEELPTCWLLAFHHWLLKNSMWAPAISRVSVRSGALWPELDTAWTLWGEPMGFAEEPVDYAVISVAGMNSIDRAITAKSRGIGQRLFRGNLLRLWQGACAVTSVQETRVLRSSHIKPWAASSVQEKVDHFNGLLLVPNLDALFNEGLISFRNDGQMLISQDWRPDDQRRMHVTHDLRLRVVRSESWRYLEYHRDVLFSRNSNTVSFRS
jgi:hypothetical protein